MSAFIAVACTDENGGPTSSGDSDASSGTAGATTSTDDTDPSTQTTAPGTSESTDSTSVDTTAGTDDATSSACGGEPMCDAPDQAMCEAVATCLWSPSGYCYADCIALTTEDACCSEPACAWIDDACDYGGE